VTKQQRARVRERPTHDAVTDSDLGDDLLVVGVGVNSMPLHDFVFDVVRSSIVSRMTACTGGTDDG
jgi:hypothetical protein